MTTTWSSSNKGEDVHGSVENTSSAAPATLPDAIASASASSSRMAPRAAFTMRMPGFALASSSLPTSPIVSGDFGRWMLTKSALEKSSSRPRSSTPIARARSAVTYGSYATSRIPKAAARWATREPTWPSPRIPSVLPCSSTPSHLDRSHRPLTRAAWDWGMLRACASIERDRVLRCRQDVRLRGVDDHHAATRGRGDVNVVEPHARAPDRNQVASGLEHLGCHAGRRTDDESRCPGHGLDELGWAERQLHVDLVTFGCHQLEPTRRKRLGDKDPRHRLITHFRAELSQTLDAPHEVRVRQSV